LDRFSGDPVVFVTLSKDLSISNLPAQGS
jgi:hypothetical protein